MVSNAAPPTDAPMMTPFVLEWFVEELVSFGCGRAVGPFVASGKDDDVPTLFEAEACIVAIRVPSISGVFVCVGFSSVPVGVSLGFSAGVAVAFAGPAGESV